MVEYRPANPVSTVDVYLHGTNCRIGARNNCGSQHGGTRGAQVNFVSVFVSKNHFNFLDLVKYRHHN